MSNWPSLDTSLSLFGGGMEVDGDVGVGVESSSGAGAEDWTQYDNSFEFSQQPHPASPSMPPPASTAAASLLLALTHDEGVSSAVNDGISIKTCNNNDSRTNSNSATISHNFPTPAPLVGSVSDRLSNSRKSLGRSQSPAGVTTPRPFSYNSLRSVQSDLTSRSAAPTAIDGASTTATAVQARPKETKQLCSGPMMFRKPLSIATVAINGSEFHIHADLLCKHSDYFSRCLRGNFAEAETQRIEIDGDEISVDDFGLWVDLLYRSHFQKAETFVLRKESTGGTLSTMQILTLWKLSDRFLHKPLADLASESLLHRLSLYSVEQWRKLYRTRPASDIRARVSRLQVAYRYCCDQELPFIDDIVTACANCPAQVYAECASLLEVDFMMLVSQRMIMAHADRQLVSKDQQRTRASTGARSSEVGMADISGLL
ncbi:hypothetical protein SEPCBS57363_000810 [Sporothrix epigloea]|uniref:BTB domain-containing protein n=1 Tax=Sporothrix epigloea TaxID=1892477 RepID=A0ABP0D8F8_9PEZI